MFWRSGSYAKDKKSNSATEEDRGPCSLDFLRSSMELLENIGFRIRPRTLEMMAVRAGSEDVIIPRLCSIWSSKAMGKTFHETSSVKSILGRRANLAIATTQATVPKANRELRPNR